MRLAPRLRLPTAVPQAAVCHATPALGAIARAPAAGTARQRPHLPTRRRVNAQLSFLMQPNKGANFVMYLVDMAPASEAAPKTPITERCGRAAWRHVRAWLGGCARTCAHARAWVRAGACVHACVHVCMCAVGVYVYVYVRARACVCLWVCVCVWVCVCICICCFTRIRRFMLVLQGQLEIDVNGKEVEVGSNHYAYLPPASEEYLSQT